MALVVDAMATRLKLFFTNHENNGRCRGKHILATDRAVRLEVSLYAFMTAVQADGHADVAFFAMKVVLPKSFSDSANSTVVAMVNVFPRIVVP